LLSRFLLPDMPLFDTDERLKISDADGIRIAYSRSEMSNSTRRLAAMSLPLGSCYRGKNPIKRSALIAIQDEIHPNAVSVGRVCNYGVVNGFLTGTEEESMVGYALILGNYGRASNHRLPRRGDIISLTNKNIARVMDQTVDELDPTDDDVVIFRDSESINTGTNPDYISTKPPPSIWRKVTMRDLDRFCAAMLTEASERAKRILTPSRCEYCEATPALLPGSFVFYDGPGATNHQTVYYIAGEEFQERDRNCYRIMRRRMGIVMEDGAFNSDYDAWDYSIFGEVHVNAPEGPFESTRCMDGALIAHVGSSNLAGALINQLLNVRRIKMTTWIETTIGRLRSRTPYRSYTTFKKAFIEENGDTYKDIYVGFRRPKFIKRCFWKVYHLKHFGVEP
jgi:hypothetical protein